MRRVRSIRGFHVLLMLAILLGVEGARLAWIQMGYGGPGSASVNAISRGAILQRTDDLVLDSGRGRFLDRKGRLLAGVTVQGLAAFPDNGMPRGLDKDIRALAASLGTDAEMLDNWLTELREPGLWKDEPGSGRALGLTDEQIRQVERSGLLGVSVLPYVNRYPAELAPLHAIGYISQHPEHVLQIYGKHIERGRMNLTNPIGGAGLEKSLDRFLQGRAPTTVKQVTDAARRPLEGLGLRLTSSRNPHFPVHVTTTLDMDIQRIAENVMNRYGIGKGAVVVLDAANADILAMVSLPRLNPYRIGAKGTDERNHAVTAVPPGSVFKTVTLAAALESGVTDWKETFFCDGKYGKYGLKCWKKGGHGHLTLEQAYAESCNVAFAGLAERLDPAWLQITAERMGLGRQIGWHANNFVDGKPLRLIEEEDAGTIFLNKQIARDGGARAGSGIGQRDVRITPLQAANMAVTILHDGYVFSPRLVKDIRYADGGLMAELKTQSSPSKYGRIESSTAARLRQGMLAVAREGTAASALSGSAWTLAGKSGTAELAGNQKARNDQWFVGYGPAKGKPHYTVAVLIEDQPAGLRNRGATLFGAIMDGIRQLEKKNRLAEEQAGER
ncbi:peptidoglycan D,D-transpeptidase FtsI family protein [Cohnella terricola]|uniref:Penicillin-binding protein n=1 Tax=Cohnella terricola TaxID=1289167 RepID=A0A559JKQ7_9BACL|nr:penicillin-binding transpeptidase domain-containing protein [Cohnella terricola]TVY00467.1 penicillin-binding protein [Cohnella terricola]